MLATFGSKIEKEIRDEAAERRPQYEEVEFNKTAMEINEQVRAEKYLIDKREKNFSIATTRRNEKVNPRNMFPRWYLT